jgi:hypothetical protein
MSPARKSAVAAGVFFLITEVAAIVGLLLYQPLLSDANYVIGAGADTRVLMGGLFELVLVAAIATASPSATSAPVCWKPSSSSSASSASCRR